MRQHTEIAIEVFAIIDKLYAIIKIVLLKLVRVENISNTN